jgi:hypothetical protein
MPYDVSWYVPSRVAYQRIYGEYALDEIRQANQDGHQWLSEGVPPVHIIADILEMTSSPPSISLLIETTTVFSHPHFGWLVVISPPNLLVSTALGVFRNVLRMKLMLVTSLEEAMAFLHEQDATLHKRDGE